MKTHIRQPQQERSIEKKNKIIQSGYELFSEMGYYGTNTAEIAKNAGVSTGIVYTYFEDKRDILICVLDIYIERVLTPVLELMNTIKAPFDFRQVAIDLVDLVTEMHKKYAKLHEALHSLSNTDDLVKAKFIQLEDSITIKIADRLKTLGVNVDNPLEKIHFAMGIIQTFTHESVFDKHSYIDYSIMKSMVITSLVNLFSFN